MDNYLVLMLAAGVGMARGALSLIFEHPLDTLKTYWQAHPSRPSLKSVYKEIYQLKGWRGFYSGAVPNVLRVMFKQGYRYPLMLAVPALYGGFFDSVLMISLATGVTIAVLEVFLITPLERLKVWLMTFPKTAGGGRAFLKAMKHHTLAVLYKGLGITALRQIMSWVTFLVVHDQLIWSARHTLGTHILSLGMLLLISFVEGGINTVVILPIDAVKTNLQKINSSNTRKILGVVRYIYSRYGIRGLYAGWSLRLIQYMIHSGFTVSLLEKLRG
jgi:Mitochondrial carrier protein